MSRKNRVPVDDRVAKAAEAALAARHFVSAIDILVGIGWLDAHAVERWRRGQIDCLEEVVRSNLPRISKAIQLFWSWATASGLKASPTAYVARSPRRQTLRFSRSGNPAIEAAYQTHWVLPELSEKKRERLAEKASHAPELVVIQPLNTEWTCHRCGGTGGLLMMETPGPACLRCVGLDDLEYLPAGDASLTRRAKANSTRYAVVALQQDTSPLRTTRSVGRAAGAGGCAVIEPRFRSGTVQAANPGDHTQGLGRQHHDDIGRVGSVYAGLGAAIRLLRNARGAGRAHSLGPAAATGSSLAPVENTTASSSGTGCAANLRGAAQHGQ
jgi:hypothetical protein